MIVRGAGAIGATAAYGLAQGALAFRGSDLKRFAAHIETFIKRSPPPGPPRSIPSTP
jgi:methylthioribose-1-phosphate isomerase